MSDMQERLYQNATKLVIEEQRCGVMMLQRRFALGYYQAAQLIDRMRREGIVDLRDNHFVVLVPKPKGAAS